MREDVIVAEVGNDGDDEIIGRVGVVDVVLLAKHLDEFVDQQLVQIDDLFLASWDELVVVVASRVTGPDNKVNGVFEVVVDPLKRSVDQADGGIAVGFLRTEDTSVAFAPMACIVTIRGRVLAVERIGMKI